MASLFAVGIGGFLGAIARYGISGLVHRHYPGSLPLGTLAVNVLGCLLIGALVTLVEDRQLLSPNVRLFVLIGFLGAMTTFSTLGYETFELLREGAMLLAIGNVVVNAVLGVAAVGLGRAAMKVIGS